MPQAAIVVFQFAAYAASVAGASGVTAIAVGHAAVAAASYTAKLALLASANAVVANQNKPESTGGLVGIAVNPREPRRLIIGTRQTGGVLSDWLIKGSKNQNLFFMSYLGEGQCGALKKVYAGGRVVYDADVSGSFVHGVRKTIPNFRSGGDRLWITYYDGRPGQTADANTISQFPGVWTANHKATGCAYVIIEMQWDSDNLTSPPAMSFELEGARLYDRRKDSTKGGSGAHRHDNPSTWEFSSNPAVALDHYLLGRYLGSVKTFGIGLPFESVPYADFAALANLCDETVATKAGGTQKRYEANGFMFADRSFKDTIKDLCRAMNARPADKGGRIGVIDGQPKTPVLTLTDLDLVEGTSDQYRPKQSWGELVTGAEGSYIDPRQNYQPVPFPRVENAAWDAEDNGQPKIETIEFEMETNQERAERLATLFVRTKRRQARLTGTYKFRAIQLEQGDWFIRTGGKFGAGKTFEVLDRMLDPRTMAVTLAAFEVDASDSAWDEDDAADIAPVTIPSVPELPALGLPGVTVTPFAFTEGALTFPALRFENPDFADVVPYGVNIEYGISTAGVLTGDTFTHIMPPGQQLSTVYGLLPNRTYVVRAQSFYGTLQGEWTAWAEISTTVDYTAGVGGGTGDLAYLDFVSLGDNVRLSDAVTVASNALLVTSLGTASAIAGQGSFATLSAINSTIANANNLLQRTGGGVFTGSLNADLTSLNTAAAIVGQGPGATAAQELVMNLYAAYGVRKGFNFTADLEGVTKSASATLTWVAGVAVYVTSAIDQQFYNTLNLPGRSMQKIRARIRPTSVTFTWEGTIFYQTAGHSWNSLYRKNIPTPDGLAQNVWVIAEWDMTALTAGGTDWVDNDIIATRFDITNGSGETWEIDWIAYGDFSADPVGIRNIADNADPTAINTAAAFTGQGALATLGFATLGTNVRLADGTTSATDALLRTSLGTAASITGQGSFATLSAITSGLANTNNLLRRTAGGLFTGALAADVTGSNTAAAITGQGALATSGYVQLGTTVRLSDGVTVATNSLLLTSLGTAAAFTGQGALATLSAVGTVQVSANAISNVAAAYTIGTGGTSAVGDGWTNYQSITITTTGGPVLITASGFATVGSDASAIQSVRIRRGTTLIYGGGGFNQSYYGEDSNAPFSATLVDQPAAGTYTYYLQGTISGSEISINQWADRAMTATELKR